MGFVLGTAIEDVKYFENLCTFYSGFLNYLCSSGLIQSTVKCFRGMYIIEKHQVS